MGLTPDDLLCFWDWIQLLLTKIEKGSCIALLHLIVPNPPPPNLKQCFILSPNWLNMCQPLKKFCWMYLCPEEFYRISPLQTLIAFLLFPWRIPVFPILPLQKSTNPLPLSQERIPLLFNREWAISNILIRRQVSQSIYLWLFILYRTVTCPTSYTLHTLAKGLIWIWFTQIWASLLHCLLSHQLHHHKPNLFHW